MKKLNYADYMEGKIKIKEVDLETVLKHFDEEIELTYDDLGKVYNEGGIYIADLIAE